MSNPYPEEFCLIRWIGDDLYQCGRMLLQWDHEHEPMPRLGMPAATCEDCDEQVWQKLMAAQDARLRRTNGKLHK